jgi:hypothetical protein
MTSFQLVSFGLFLVLVAVAYRKELVSFIVSLGRIFPERTIVEPAEPSIAIAIVEDIVNITELRDKLASQGCVEGVDACTVLLRVIVEHEHPVKHTPVTSI